MRAGRKPKEGGSGRETTNGWRGAGGGASIAAGVGTGGGSTVASRAGGGAATLPSSLSTELSCAWAWWMREYPISSRLLTILSTEAASFLSESSHQNLGCAPPNSASRSARESGRELRKRSYTRKKQLVWEVSV
jgi:hypothetical protein